MNSLIPLDRLNILSKKWYLQIVLHLLDLALVNVWLLYNRNSSASGINEQDQLYFVHFKASASPCL